MKKVTLLFAFFSLVFTNFTIAEAPSREYNKALDYLDNGGEVYFQFENPNDPAIFQKLTRTISIDHPKGSELKAYANRREFNEFLKLGIPYRVETHPGDLLGKQPMAKSSAELRLDWDRYPTFEAFKEFMYEMEATYPDKAKVVKIGESVSGRDLLYLIISDNINTTEAEPRVMYSSAMHGDETGMYVPFLRLADYLLSNYDSDDLAKKIIDNIELWICPLENPDGTYRNDNSTVDGARRANNNGEDLNRHYPWSGETLDESNVTEPEALAVMNLVDSLQFELSINSHGGAELLNYPYDYANTRHPDDDWMEYVYRAWADETHSVNSNYLVGENDGIVRGWVWYQVDGSRMDYFTYHKNMREVTFESTSTKLVAGTDFPEIWDVYHMPLLHYLEEALYGINGTVTTHTGEGIVAKIEVLNHDDQSSFVYSKPVLGDFYRPIFAGTYDLKITPEGQGYSPYTVSDVKVQNGEATTMHVVFGEDGQGTSLNPMAKVGDEGIRITPLQNSVQFTFQTEAKNYTLSLHDVHGKKVQTFSGKPSENVTSITWDGKNNQGTKLNAGYYIATLESAGQKLSNGFVYTK